MSLRIVVVNGLPESGKTTFETMCKDVLKSSCYISSIVNPTKEIATLVGWSGRKELKDRIFLSNLKDLLDNYCDFSFKLIKEEIQEIRAERKIYDVEDINAVYLIDMREPLDIDRAKKELDAETLCVLNPRALFNENTCHADRPSEILNYKYDYYVNNNGTIDDLLKIVEEFCANIKSGAEKLLHKEN